MMNIFKKFPISELEYAKLEKKFNSLCCYAAWQLVKRNSNDKFNVEAEDVIQDLKISMLRAGSHYKRQMYITKCFEAIEESCKDGVNNPIFEELYNLWKNRIKSPHQKFGERQEELLEVLMQHLVPVEDRPDINQELSMDSRFVPYCKAIIWNAQKALGKQISKEKSLMAVLSMDLYSSTYASGAIID